jgi:hypothetical protein
MAKFDNGKPPLGLIPPEALLQISEVFGFGAEKYGKHSFYRRRLESMIDILIEKGVISSRELEHAVKEKKRVWDENSKAGIE